MAGFVNPKDAAAVNLIGSAAGLFKPGQSSTLYNPVQAAGTGAQAAPAPNRTTTPGPANSNGGSGGAARVDKSNDIALQLAGLGSADTQLNAGLAAIDKALGGLTGQYDTETTRNEGTYKTNSDTNQNNLQRNKQTALVNASQGRQGLFGTLASLGALNGSGIDLANRAVQKGANDDLSGAADNYGENKTTLETAITGYRDEDARRRKEAATAAENAKTNARGDSAKSKMSFYSNLANDYAAMENAAEAKRYTDLAASMYPQIAAANIPNSNIAYSGAAFNPGSLESYIAGADSTVVKATPTQGATLPGLIASPIKKKETQKV